MGCRWRNFLIENGEEVEQINIVYECKQHLLDIPREGLLRDWYDSIKIPKELVSYEFEFTEFSVVPIDSSSHSILEGLSEDDHIQYPLTGTST